LMIFPGGDYRQWTAIGAQAVDDPATGTNSGICGVYIFVTGSTYTSNLTGATGGYLGGDPANNATTIDTPHDQNFDIIVWARFNTTDTDLDIQFAECNLTWTGNITATEPPDHIHKTGFNGTMMWVNFVWDNSDVGYDIIRNQKNIDISNINIKGYK